MSDGPTMNDLMSALADYPVELDRAIAAEFEVAVSTVDRWRRGVARPHPRVRELIIKRLSIWRDAQ